MVKKILFFLILTIQLFCAAEKFKFSRLDGSKIHGYLSYPDNQKSYPIILLIDGSGKMSVTTSHNSLASRLNSHGLAVVSIEKRGICDKIIDNKEFWKHYCFSKRVDDHLLLLEKIENNFFPNFNGKLIVLGGSEGGKIAPKISISVPDMIEGVVLIGSGGGLGFEAEMKNQVKNLSSELNFLTRWGISIRKIFYPNEIEDVFAKMKKNPESLEMAFNLSYKWFASYLDYDLLSDILKVDMPIYMIHGEKDIMVPIKSADIIHDAFEKTGKKNLTYARYKHIGHSMRGEDKVYSELISWLQTTFENQ